MAYSFTAANSQSLATASTPVSTTPCTLACWYRTTSTTNATALVVLQDANGQSRIQIGTNGIASPKRAIQAIALDSNGVIATVGQNETSYSANTWYHGAAVFASTSDVYAYFNGSAGIRVGAGSVVVSGIDQILIGARFTTSLGSYHDGQIADVGVWNAALTAAEIASLAKGMTCDKVRPQNLVYYAPLVRDLIDQKGGLAIANNNGATVANHPRIYP